MLYVYQDVRIILVIQRHGTYTTVPFLVDGVSEQRPDSHTWQGCRRSDAGMNIDVNQYIPQKSIRIFLTIFIGSCVPN